MEFFSCRVCGGLVGQYENSGWCESCTMGELEITLSQDTPKQDREIVEMATPLAVVA